MIRLTALAAFCLAGVAAHAQPPASDAPIKLGAILDMGGVYADVTGSGSETAARMAIEDFGGKLLGRPIQFLVADHQNKPDIAAAVATRWYDQEGVTAIMDVASSSPALAVMNVADKRHRIVMLSGPGALAITNRNCIATAVHYTYNTYANAQTVGRAILQQGGKRWFFITADYTFGHALENDTAAVVKAAGGQVLGDAKAPLDNTDFSTMLLTAQQSGADVIGLANGGNDLVNTVKQASEFGLTRQAEIRGARVEHQRHPRHGSADRAEPRSAGRLLLGHRRRDARMVRAVLRSFAQDAEPVTGGALLGHDALPSRRDRRRHDRRRARDAEDARYAGERLLRP